MFYMEHTNNPEAVAETVRVALDTAGISLREVTRSTGIPNSTLSRRMTGNSSFTLAEIYQIAGLLQVLPSELIRRAESEPISA